MMGDMDYGLDFVGIVYVPNMGDISSFQSYFWNQIKHLCKLNWT